MASLKPPSLAGRALTAREREEVRSLRTLLTGTTRTARRSRGAHVPGVQTLTRDVSPPTLQYNSLKSSMPKTKIGSYPPLEVLEYLIVRSNGDFIKVQTDIAECNAGASPSPSRVHASSPPRDQPCTSGRRATVRGAQRSPALTLCVSYLQARCIWMTGTCKGRRCLRRARRRATR